MRLDYTHASDPKYVSGYISAMDEYREDGFNLTVGINSFKSDPPDSPFQEGYLQALLDIQAGCLNPH